MTTWLFIWWRLLCSDWRRDLICLQFKVVACMFVMISLDTVYGVIAALHLRKFSWF